MSRSEIQSHRPDRLRRCSTVTRSCAQWLGWQCGVDLGDERTEGAIYEFVGNDVCPKGLPLQTQIAFLRRKMAKTGVG